MAQATDRDGKLLVADGEVKIFPSEDRGVMISVRDLPGRRVALSIPYAEGIQLAQALNSHFARLVNNR